MVLMPPLLSRQVGLWLLIGFLLVLIPITAVSSSVNWLDLDPAGLTRFFSVLTQTAGKEGFVITLMLLIFWTYWRAPNFCHQWLNHGIQLALLLSFTMVAKVGLKQVTHSPRPYTEAMVQRLIIPSEEHFYRLDHQQQEAAVTLMAEKVSPYRLLAWQQERDFSFPSGHTAFAVACLLFFGGLLLEQKRWVSVAALFSWSVMVGLSRLWLGMHRPEDLWGAAILVGVFYVCIPRRYPGLERAISLILRMKKKMG